MKYYLIFSILLLLGQLKPSLAYDVDTHFYGTYAMARYAGINHFIASRIATYAQWMDETYLSSPMIPTAIIGTKIRRLLHFPCTELAGDFNNGATHFFHLKTLSETVPNHPIASELIHEGMREGWLMKSGAGLHVIEDSYAHAGTPAETGHAHLWHWPDRPYAAPEKYTQMVDTVFKVMVAIRELLPDEALDFDLQDKQRLQAPNYTLDAVTLASAYSSIPQLRETVEKNILTDPEYVRFAFNHILNKSLKEYGYFKPGISQESLRKIITDFKLPFDGHHDTKEILALFGKKSLELERAGRPILNKEKILSKYGFVANDPMYLKSWDSHEELINAVVTEMIQGQVPTPLSETHKVEIEVEGPVRAKELEIRIRNMRKLITTLFGIDVRFTNNPVSYYYKRSQNPELKPKTNNEIVISMDHQEQALWNRMIFRFIFPNADFPSDAPVTYLLTLGESPWVLWDATHSRLVPTRENRYYQKPELFAKLKEWWEVKRLISSKTVREMLYHTYPGHALDRTGLLYQ